MKCPNCGKDEAHFVPPSLGESGFYICDCETQEQCPDCDGKGKTAKHDSRGIPSMCFACKGTGLITHPPQKQTTDCNYCNGFGTVGPDEPCPKCKSSGHEPPQNGGECKHGHCRAIPQMHVHHGTAVGWCMDCGALKCIDEVHAGYEWKLPADSKPSRCAELERALTDFESQKFQQNILSALRECIKAHGPITLEHISSAEKRIRRNIYASTKLFRLAFKVIPGDGAKEDSK